MGAGTVLYTLSAHNCWQPGAITLGRCWSETSGRWVEIKLWTAAVIDCSCVCFESHCSMRRRRHSACGVKPSEVRACDFEFEPVRAEERASIYIRFGRKSRGTLWWMSCSKGEQRVNRGKDESRRNLENFSTVTQSMQTIHRAGRPSNQAAGPLV